MLLYKCALCSLLHAIKPWNIAWPSKDCCSGCSGPPFAVPKNPHHLPVHTLFKLWNELANHLSGLPLVGLAVLEREPTRPLVCARLPANLAVAAGKQNTP